jgi:antitoxin MazE
LNRIVGKITRPQCRCYNVSTKDVMRLTKTLTEHGNSLALVIDKPILDLLKIAKDTPLEITTDGHSLVISPALSARRRTKVLAAFEDTLRKYPNALKRLAQ